MVGVNRRDMVENKLPLGTPDLHRNAATSVDQGTPRNIHIPGLQPPPQNAKCPVVGSATLQDHKLWDLPRHAPLVKPAKLNIPEFEGHDSTIEYRQ